MLKNLENKYQPKRVVVIGKNGFVAKNLCSKLDGKYPFLALSKDQINLLKIESQKALVEILDQQDLLIVTSALTPDRGKDLNAFKANLEMIYNLAASLEQKKVGHLIYISSDAVYADDLNFVAENLAAEPSGLYGLMHLSREKILSDLCVRLQIPFCIVRPCAIYGYGDTHNSYGPNRFIKSAHEKSQIELFGEGEEKRDHLHIDDFTDLLLSLIENKSVGLINVANGVSYSFMQVALEIQKAFDQLKNKKVEIICKPRAANSAILHKHYDSTFRLKTFPQLLFRDLQVGISQVVSI